MKIKLVIAACAALLLVGLFSTTVMADPVLGHHLVGSLSIETPVGMTPDRPQDNTPSVLGDLHVTNLLGPVGVFFAGQIQTKKGLPYDRENKFRTGLELPLGYSGLTVYTYFERRFDTADNRFMVGCRWGFNEGY